MIPVTVTFYGDVGFDRSYNHVIDFSNETERENYFSSKILKTIQNCAYNKPMNSLQIKCDYEEALSFTYCKFIMGSNSSHQKKIFAWVDDVILKTDQKDENGNYVPILEINIAVDPWQTFLFNFTLGESFVVREHINRWSVNEDTTRGWELDNTSDDNSCGCEIRGEPIINFRNKVNIFDYYSDEVEDIPKHDDYIFWLLIQYCLSGQSYMSVILVPVTMSARSCRFCYRNYDRTGECLRLSEVMNDEYIEKLGLLSSSIASVNLIPFDLGYFVNNETTRQSIFYFDDNVTIANNTHYTPTYFNNHAVINLGLGATTNPLRLLNIVKKSVTINVNEPNPPINNEVFSIDNKHEQQLYKQPYKRLSFINENNVETAKFPDIFANSNEPFKSFDMYILIDSVDVRCRIVPKIFANKETDSKYWMEFNCISVDVIKNNWYDYLVQEREATREMIQSQNNQNLLASAIGGVSSGVSMGGQQALKEGGNVAGGLALGLGIGAIQTVGEYIVNQHYAFQQQDIREKAIRRKANNIMQSGTIKSILLISPYICFTTCDTTTLKLKSLEFHKYGYNTSRYYTPNTKTRKYFNFIATNIVKIEGSLNNNIKMALMEIFNNGVTIWHGDYINELSGIGDYSKENIERSLL